MEFLLFWYGVPICFQLQRSLQSLALQRKTHNLNSIALRSVLFLPSVVLLATSCSMVMEFLVTEVGLTVLMLSATSSVMLKVRSSDRAVIGAAGIKHGCHYSST